MYYLKIENGIIKQAPHIVKINNYTIYGYDSEQNEENLLKAGYTKFSKPAGYYEIKDGAITEKQPQIEEKTVFTKLQIRRAFRALNIEDELDSILQSNPALKKDWNEAVQIDLQDQQITSIIEAGLLSLIKEKLQNEYTM